MGSIIIRPGFGKNLITVRDPMAAVLSCHLHVENAEHVLNVYLPLAAVLLLSLSGKSLLAAEDGHDGPPGRQETWLQAPTLPLTLVFHPQPAPPPLCTLMSLLMI